MKQLFELEWLGGAAEHHFRKERPGIDDLPWGTLDTSDYPPDIVEAARATWTESAFTEYKAVAAFAEVVRALCESQAPLDLVGMASGFLADEVVHVELASRVAMELGGATPRYVDLDAMVMKPPAELSAFQRANDLVLRISAIAEAFSGKMAVGAMRTTTHPLTRAVYERIVADESLHHRLGRLYFDWASDRMDDAERSRLADVALRTLKALATTWQSPRSPRSPRYRATREQVNAIGWLETPLYREQVRVAVRESIAEPLASYGIKLPNDEIESLLRFPEISC
jgi:hypothetical protein